MKHIFTLLVLACSALWLTSCGVDEDSAIAKDYSTTARTIEFYLTAGSPSNDGDPDTRLTSTDNGTYGMRYFWTATDRIAMYGIPFDSLVLLKPYYADSSSFTSSNEVTFYAEVENLKFGNRASEFFYLTYPGDKFTYSDDYTATLSFEGQDGLMSTLQDNYMYSWSMAVGYGSSSGTSTEGYVYFYDAMTTTTSAGDTATLCNRPDYHMHSMDYDFVIMDNKFALLRLSLVNADATASLATDMIATESDEILSMDIIDDNGHVINAAALNLVDGTVTTDDVEGGSDTLTIQAYKTFLTPIDLVDGSDDDEVQDLYDATSGASWGSTFYVALPCHQTEVTVSLSLQLHTKNGKTYYGRLERNSILHEGNVYITSPIRCTDDSSVTPEAATLYVYS